MWPILAAIMLRYDDREHAELGKVKKVSNDDVTYHTSPRHAALHPSPAFLSWQGKSLSSAPPPPLLFFFSLFLFLLTKEIPGALLAGF
jgi:hypothetical protein